MTMEEKNIKICEALGWKNITRLDSGWHGWREQGPLEELPQHFTDLNAMHEAEKLLTPKQANAYIWLLPSIWHATATQRAEAFGKALNLW